MKHATREDAVSRRRPLERSGAAAALHLQSAVGNRAYRRLLHASAARSPERSAPGGGFPAVVGGRLALWQPAVPAAPRLQRQPQRDAAAREWRAHPGIHHHFRRGLRTYRSLRPLYQARGIGNPAEYITRNIVQVTFFGHGAPAHQDMRAPLQAAENALRARRITPNIRTFGGFVPRRIAGTRRLSNHALGRAIDINRSTNKLIRNRDDIRVIQAFAFVDLGQRQTAAAMRQASQTFQATFNQTTIDHLKKTLKDWKYQRKMMREIQKDDPDYEPIFRPHLELLSRTIPWLRGVLRSVKRRRTALNEYARVGFFDLEQELIDELVAAGLEWGGAWRRKKDFMHFELP